MNYREEVQFWLDALRKGTQQHRAALGYVDEYTKEGGLTLKDIGTTKAELEKCRVLGCKVNAQFWLDALRKGTQQHRAALGYVDEYTKEGGLTLKDIGTTKAELSSFKQVA